MNAHKIADAFKESVSYTLNSNLQDTQSIGSTVSLQTFALEPPMEYEEMIQKLEADIRKHIRIQNQLKLHIESLQWKVDEKEKNEIIKTSENEKLQANIQKLKETIIELDRKKELEI